MNETGTRKHSKGQRAGVKVISHRVLMSLPWKKYPLFPATSNRVLPLEKEKASGSWMCSIHIFGDSYVYKSRHLFESDGKRGWG